MKFVYLCEMKVNVLILLLLLVSFKASAQEYFWKDVYPPFDTLMHKAESLSYQEADYNEMLPVIEQMYRIAKGKEGNRVMLSRAMFWDIWANPRKNEQVYYHLIDKTAALIDTVKYAYDYHRLLMIKQTILSGRGEFLESYKLANRLVSYFDQTGDKVLWAYCMGNIGNIFADLNEFDEAVSYAEQACAVFETNGLKGKVLMIRSNLSTIYNMLGESRKAVDLLKPVVLNFPPEASPRVRILYLISYCGHLQDMKELEYYTKKTYKAVLDYPDPFYIQVATLNMGTLFYRKGEPDSARYYIRKVQAFWENEPNLIMKERTYELLSQLFAGQHRYDSAYYYKVLHQNCQDSLRGGDVLLNLNRIKVRKDIEEYRYQLEQSKLKAQVQKRYVYIVSAVFVLVLLFAAVIFRLLAKRATMEKKLREVENKEYHERIRNEKLVIDSRNRELSSNTVLLTKKNLVLKDLLNQIEELGNDGKIESKIEKELKNKIAETLRDDDEWEYFKLHFERVHPDFFNKLKNAFPDLTDNELRLCAYARLNLSIKQIAQMLSVQPKTVVQARYRMRKKMDLENDELLNDYLGTF